MALTDKLSAIGAAIRAKTGKTDKLTLDEMPTEIEGIQTGGGDGPEKYIEAQYETVELPNATKIKPYAFHNDSMLKNIIMPKVTSISSYAFESCTGLAITELPEGLKSLGAHAFSRCSSLAITKIPDGLTSIDTYTFRECSSFVSIEMPAKLTGTIFSYAFYNCSNLKTVTFKSKPWNIEPTVFHMCPNITTINVPWAEGAVSGAPWGAANATINYNYTGE